MTARTTDISIVELLRTPPERMKARDIEGLTKALLASCQLMAECGLYEEAASLGRATPGAGLSLLHSMDLGIELGFPLVRQALIEHLDNRASQEAIRAAAGPAHEAPSAYDDARRQEAFKREPGRYILGATTAPGMPWRSRAIDGHVRVEGRTCPWIFSPCGVRAAKVGSLAEYLSATKAARGYVVASHLDVGVELPTGISFVEVR
ncbi:MULTISPECIES: hypothetical protein [Methylobacterium]|uniref:hypothetical protein n=1 Tax=Methylobacterium TaxID=407 RepID=UPI00272EB799|nr:hypothetical protein [Methylobacterium sp.]